jgi:hypothetical protein
MHFFTEIDTLKNQNTSGNGLAYGPSGSSGSKDLFRVTSTHKTDGDAKAIAVCKGIILVQEQTGNSNLVNIVLKPFEQPPFEFPKIKYFIYRGINKSSLVSGSLVAGSQNALSSTNSNLTQSIWIDYKAFNGSTAEPPIALLGLGMNTANSPYKDSDSIDGIFNQINATHQLPVVQAGWHIGDFGADHVGFEIMFESLGFVPILEIARKSENAIEVTTLASSPTQADFFEHWHDKEDILNYIDPCAFFGSFYNHDLKVKNSNGSESLKKGETIYNDILINFINKNKCYIDIRNEFNFSLNYFKNYGTSATNNTTNIKLAKGANASTTINYYTNGWPILILDNSGFSNTSKSYQELTIQLPCGNGTNPDNPAPLVYLDKAFKTGFRFPDTFLLKKKFLPLSVSNNYTQGFKIAVPWISNNIFSSYIKIKHCKRKSNATLPTAIGTQIRRTDDLDALFCTRMNFDTSLIDLNTKVFEEEIYIDSNNTQDFDAIFNLGISFDEENVTLFACPINYFNFENNKTRDTLRIVADKTNDNYLKKLGENAETAELTKTEVNTNEGGVDVIFYQENYLGFSQPFNKAELKHLLGIGFIKAEWNAIIASATNTSNFTIKYPVWISIDTKQNLVDGDNEYTVFDLKLKGYKVSGTSVSIVTINSNLKQYANGHL